MNIQNSENLNTITEWQAKLLSDIFRIFVKEIVTDDDKAKLAPGELGINYTEGCFYIKDPYTGELFSPNSIQHIKQIMSKYDSITNILNADRISGIRYYSDISQLTQLGITLTCDSVIRQMEYPSILISKIETERYQELGFPSETGILAVNKISPEYVTVSFYDNLTLSTYNGKYNPFKQLFEGWIMATGTDVDYAETVGGGDSTKITGTEDLTDLMVISVRVSEDLNPGAKVSYNGGEYLPIINANGSYIATSVAANNIIMLIYDDSRKGWILVDGSDSSISATMEVLTTRVSSNETKINLAIKDYRERISQLSKDMESKISALAAAPGNIISYTSTFTAVVNGTDTISVISNFIGGVDKLIVNYNQTVLREGIDYIIEGNGIQILKFALNEGDILHFIVIKQTAGTQ